MKRSFKNKVKEYRLKALIGTKQELSKMTGINRSTLSLIENNKLPLSLSNALRIAKALRCSLDDLFETEGNPNE